MLLLLACTALFTFWVLLAVLVNCGESLLETMAELALAALFCLLFSLSIGSLVYLATTAHLRPASAVTPHAHPE